MSNVRCEDMATDGIVGTTLEMTSTITIDGMDVTSRCAVGISSSNDEEPEVDVVLETRLID